MEANCGDLGRFGSSWIPPLSSGPGISICNNTRNLGVIARRIGRSKLVTRRRMERGKEERERERGKEIRVREKREGRREGID